MTPRELLLNTTKLFRKAGIPDPESDSSLLLSFLCRRTPLELRLDSDTMLSASILSEYDALVQKRLRRIPLQYLLREAPFGGRMFFVDERVLIPRPETELLCDWALEILNHYSCPRVADICCGSGCIGLTIKAERPDSEVLLTDISADALSVCRINAARTGVSVSFSRCDLMDGLPSSYYDLIVSNPPYIASESCRSLQKEVQMEPLLALDGGTDGLDLYRRLIPEAMECLAPGGVLMLEVGEGEAHAVSSLLTDHQFFKPEIRMDLNGILRMILARKPRKEIS